VSESSLVQLGSCLNRASTWNPLRAGSDALFRYIDLSSVDQDTKSISDAREVACGEAPSRARQLVATGDVLVSTVRPNLNGVARVPSGLDGATASTGFCVLRPEPKKLDSSYLFQWVKSSAFISDMVSKATGASYPAVSDRIIFESEIPLPPLEKQRRIAAILDQAETLRTQRRQALAHLNTLTQSLFLDTQLNASVTDMPLGGIAENSRGAFVNGPFGSDLLTNELQETGVPVVYIRDIRDGEYKRVSKVCVSESKATSLSVCEVRSGDVLIAKVGDPPGISAVYPAGQPKAIVTQDVIRIRVNGDKVVPEYLSCYLNSSIGRWKLAGITIEATRARFSLGDLKRLEIQLPSLSLQQTFATRIAAIEALKATHRTALAQLDALFASLQQRAFAGEL
jgi:type I restriction enzyme, S subunit